MDFSVLKWSTGHKIQFLHPHCDVKDKINIQYFVFTLFKGVINPPEFVLPPKSRDFLKRFIKFLQ